MEVTDFEAKENLIQVFMDGSRMEGRTGFGVTIKYRFFSERCRGHLPDYASVFQGEVAALAERQPVT